MSFYCFDIKFLFYLSVPVWVICLLCNRHSWLIAAFGSKISEFILSTLNPAANDADLKFVIERMTARSLYLYWRTTTNDFEISFCAFGSMKQIKAIGCAITGHLAVPSRANQRLVALFLPHLENNRIIYIRMKYARIIQISCLHLLGGQFVTFLVNRANLD